MIHTVAHHAVGVLGDHDSAVDQHTQPQQHAEHDHEVEGIAQQVDDYHREQQGHRNAEPHDEAAAKTHGGHHQYHHQRQCGQDVALQFPHLQLGELGLVLGGYYLDPGRYAGPRGVHQGKHLRHRVDDIGFGALGDIDGNGIATVVAGEAGAVLESPPHGRHVRQGDDLVAGAADRQLQYVAGLLHHPRNLDREPAVAGIDAARGDQAIVALQGGNQFFAGYPVGIEGVRVDGDLQQFLALALQVRAQYRGDGLDIVAQMQGGLVDAAFAGLLPHQVDLDDGEVIDRDFLHDGLFRAAGQLRPGSIYRLAYVTQGGVHIHCHIDLHEDRRHALGGGAAEFNQALELAQLDLHGLHQQPLGILR